MATTTVRPYRALPPFIGPMQPVEWLRGHARAAVRVVGAMQPAESAAYFRNAAHSVNDRQTARILLVMAREFARIARASRTGEA